MLHVPARAIRNNLGRFSLFLAYDCGKQSSEPTWRYCTDLFCLEYEVDAAVITW